MNPNKRPFFTPMKKIKKETFDRNGRKLLKEEYMAKGIMQCELRLDGCWKNNGLGFAHKDKRIKYLGRQEELWTFKETVLACWICHDLIEYNRALTLEVFNKLRG